MVPLIESCIVITSSPVFLRLAEFPKILLNNIAEGQEQLKMAAALAVQIMANEAENVKLGATSLTSDDTPAQVSRQDYIWQA